MYNIKKTILIDLDGVLNTYDGKYDKNIIPPIKQGALEFLKDLSEDFIIKIFTSRSLLLAAKWIFDNKLENYVEDITNIKEPCHLIIDDRCVNFKGNYEELKGEISRFKSWYTA